MAYVTITDEFKNPQDAKLHEFKKSQTLTHSVYYSQHWANNLLVKQNEQNMMGGLLATHIEKQRQHLHTSLQSIIFKHFKKQTSAPIVIEYSIEVEKADLESLEDNVHNDFKLAFLANPPKFNLGATKAIMVALHQGLKPNNHKMICIYYNQHNAYLRDSANVIKLHTSYRQGYSSGSQSCPNTPFGPRSHSAPHIPATQEAKSTQPLAAKKDLASELESSSISVPKANKFPRGKHDYNQDVARYCEELNRSHRFYSNVKRFKTNLNPLLNTIKHAPSNNENNRLSLLKQSSHFLSQLQPEHLNIAHELMHEAMRSARFRFNPNRLLKSLSKLLAFSHELYPYLKNKKGKLYPSKIDVFQEFVLSYLRTLDQDNLQGLFTQFNRNTSFINLLSSANSRVNTIYPNDEKTFPYKKVKKLLCNEADSHKLWTAALQTQSMLSNFGSLFEAAINERNPNCKPKEFDFCDKMEKEPNHCSLRPHNQLAFEKCVAKIYNNVILPMQPKKEERTSNLRHSQSDRLLSDSPKKPLLEKSATTGDLQLGRNEFVTIPLS